MKINDLLKESKALVENPLLVAAGHVLRGLASQGWKHGAKAGAKGAAKFTATKTGQRVAGKVGANTVKNVGVAGGKIAGGAAGLTADAYLVNKLTDKYGENEVTNVLQQAQAGKKQMFTDMLNNAILTGVISTDELDSAMGMYESSLGYSDGWDSFSKNAVMAFKQKNEEGLFKFIQKMFPNLNLQYNEFKEDWATWVAEAGSTEDALEDFISFYYEMYYNDNSVAMDKKAEKTYSDRANARRSRIDAEAGGGGAGGGGAGAGGGAGSGAAAGAGTGGGAGPGNSSGGGAHGNSSGMGGSAGRGDTGAADSTPSPAMYLGSMTPKKKKKKKKKNFDYGKGIYETLDKLDSCPRTKSTGCQCENINKLSEAEETVKAICNLEHTEGDVSGMFKFKQKPGKATIIKGIVKGLTPGKHGFHIHEFGDLSDGCKSAGGHYNPDGVSHGDKEKGHVGDLGNIVADQSGTARFQIKAERVELSDVVGRAIVIHADEDDLGKGGDEESLKTGNAGDRLGCGVIRLREVVEEKYTRTVSDKHFDRNQLPQIRHSDLEKSPFTFEEGAILTCIIKPVQSQRVQGLAEDAENGFFDDDYRPLILDSNGYLVNGHHRLDAAHVLGLKEVKAIQVNATLEELMKHFEHKISYDKVTENKINKTDMRAKEFLYLKFKKSLVEGDSPMFGANEYDMLDLFLGSGNINQIFGNVKRGTPDFKHEGIKNIKMYLKKKNILDVNKGAGMAYQNLDFKRINPKSLDQSKLTNLLTVATKLSDNTNQITSYGEDLKNIIINKPMPTQTDLTQVDSLQRSMVGLKGRQIRMVDSMDTLIKDVFQLGAGV